MAFLQALEGDRASRFAPPYGSLFRARPASSHARCQTLPAPGPTTLPWGGPSREWSTMPVSSRGPRRRRSWWCHTCSSTPSTRMPAKRVGSSDAAWERRLDVGPHGVPRSCQLSGQSCNGGSLEAQLSDRPADRPHTHTRPGSTHRVVLLSESHDPAGAFAAYPALLKPPEPCRDPGPGRVDHLHHHTPMTLSDSAHNPGSQHSDHRTLCRAPEPVGCEPRSSPYKPTSRSHRSQRSSDTQQQQVGSDTAWVLDDSGGRSPPITWDLDLYPQPPTNTRSPTLNSEEPLFCLHLRS